MLSFQHKSHHDTTERRIMIRTQVQLTEEQARALKDLATIRKVSMAELVRQAVNLLLRSSADVDTNEQRRRAIAAAGRFRSGQSDISSEHDQYLTDA